MSVFFGAQQAATLLGLSKRHMLKILHELGYKPVRLGTKKRYILTMVQVEDIRKSLDARS